MSINPRRPTPAPHRGHEATQHRAHDDVASVLAFLPADERVPSVRVIHARSALRFIFALNVCVVIIGAS